MKKQLFYFLAYSFIGIAYVLYILNQFIVFLKSLFDKYEFVEYANYLKDLLANYKIKSKNKKSVN